MTGRFIVLEGGEGCGKSTQARFLADGLAAVLTREPGGTEIGARLRSILLDPLSAALGTRAEALLMAADRAQHVEELVRPSLDAGRHVVSDRYLYSSVAYQGAGRGLGSVEVGDLSRWATGGLLPDLVILLDLDPLSAQARLDRDLDRFEQAGGAFHRLVRQSFLEQAGADPRRWAVLDAALSVDELRLRIAGLVLERLELAVGHDG